jgi:hypothetical protein
LAAIFFNPDSEVDSPIIVAGKASQYSFARDADLFPFTLFACLLMGARIPAVHGCQTVSLNPVRIR